MRAALTFVACDKSKQKHAFIPMSLYEQDRSGGKFFRFFVFYKLHHRNIPHRHLKVTSLSTEKIYITTRLPYFHSSRTVHKE